MAYIDWGFGWTVCRIEPYHSFAHQTYLVMELERLPVVFTDRPMASWLQVDSSLCVEDFSHAYPHKWVHASLVLLSDRTREHQKRPLFGASTAEHQVCMYMYVKNRASDKPRSLRPQKQLICCLFVGLSCLASVCKYALWR